MVTDDLDDPSDRGVPVPYVGHDCLDGWLVTSTEDNPRPCPQCRPHLARTTDRHGLTAWRPTHREDHHG